MIDPVWLTVFSELFVNLSAGWFGAAVIVPVVSEKPRSVNLWLLIANTLSAIFSLVIAFKLRKLL